MKILFASALLALLFAGCASDEQQVKVNNIPPKTTHVKAEAPGAPSYREYPGARYYDNYYYNGRYYNGYYYNRLGNGSLRYQDSAEDIDNQRRRVD